MAKAKKLPSGSWRCQVYSHTEEIPQPDGTFKKKRIYKSFTSDIPGPKGKREAERAAAEWAADKENRTKHNYDNMILSDAYSKYIDQRSAVLSPATVREYKRSAGKDLQSIMSIRLSDLTQDAIQKAINMESLSHSPKSVRNMHGLLSADLSVYKPDFALKTDLPKKVRPKIYVPLDEEIRRIIEYVKNDPMEIPIMLAVFGPMRRSEICALDSDHINGNVVHVEYAMVLNDNHEWVIKRPKSYAGDRYIEFPDVVAKKLEGINGRVTELNPAMVSDRFTDILKRCGITHFRFHDLRHYCASVQHAVGVPDSYIMQRGGWGNDGVLKSVYRHTLEEREKEMNNRANDYFSQLCNTKCNTD